MTGVAFAKQAAPSAVSLVQDPIGRRAWLIRGYTVSHNVLPNARPVVAKFPSGTLAYFAQLEIFALGMVVVQQRGGKPYFVRDL